MSATRGFDKAVKKIAGMRKRVLNPREALRAIGKEARSAHVRYFRSGKSQATRGGGPPKALWPGLTKKTIARKAKLGKPAKKLIFDGLLWKGYTYSVRSNSVLIWNKIKHAVFLQAGIGVGKGRKRKKRFIVVTTDLKRHDPKLLKRIKLIYSRFISTGKVR